MPSDPAPDPGSGIDPAPERAHFPATGCDDGRPVGPTPAMDFWQALYARRSVRRFRADPVPRELIDQVLHAGIWAPSSCNYQMWDVVAVDDPALNARLGALSSQMGNAPVNLVVSYAREFSQEGWANVQSASAMIQNMSLAAQVLGLGTFWITQMGEREEVRAIVGLPHDRLVIAVLALGYPKVTPQKGPPRRPLAQVTHYNHYAGRPIPSSLDPADWPSDLLAVYQRARVLNGLRHNKPRPWETRALLDILERFVPHGRAAPAEDAPPAPRWLDVLPCTGILTERMSRERRGFRFDVVERTPDVAAFVSARTRPRAGRHAWPAPDPQRGFGPPPDGAYDVVTCLFRLEDLAPRDRPALLCAMAHWVAPGGRVLLGFVSARSFHGLTESLRRRGGGPKGVEYVLAPDPNIGPFEPLEPRDVERLAAEAGLAVEGRLGRQAVPGREELAFRTRNLSPSSRRLVRAAAALASAAGRLPGLEARRGRFQYLCLRRA